MTGDKAVPDALRELWRQRARLLASNVATDGREHREIAQAASLIRQDYHDRFLVELLQNANDQALLGNVFDSTVVVARSQRFLAVSNGGEALTPRNLERLSSLADSDKTGVLVGNKGVGFKAVYQVTDAPEIYSAATAGRTGALASVVADFGVGIALEQHPFQQQVLVKAVEDEVRSFFVENRGLASALERKGVHDPLEAVRPEFARVAGFKFPLARSRSELAERLSDLQIPDAQHEVMRTLVVLPLRDRHASQDVERAIDRLVGTGSDEPGQAELAVLFLSGVRRIVVIDHVRDSRWEFSCSVTRTEGPRSEATVSVIQPDGTERSTCFWVYRRDALDCAIPVAAQRKPIIAQALQEFGLEAWKADDPLPITLALPMPAAGLVASLGPAGRFCLGLPTQQSTGLPVHVDARFFATISRTGLDFGLPYNGLLLDVAAELLGELLGDLRHSSNIENRRAATLALHRSRGALADRVFIPGGVADAAVVLAWDGNSYLRRSECRLPAPQERDLLRSLSDVLFERPDLLAQLPEEALLSQTPEVLESIGLPPFEASPHPWLQRESGVMSAVELAAHLHRADGSDYWEEFVVALLGCFDGADLQEQFWLPVGDTELAAPSQRVFLPARVDIGGDDEEVTNVPFRVAAMIRLIDDRVMRLREDGRALTKLANRLVDARLVRRPRKTELLEEALFPALAKAAARQDGEIALELFGQAMHWIASMKDASRKKLDFRRAWVPVALPTGDKIRWSKAREVYLGQGWGLSGDQERLIREAYPDRCLVSFVALRDHFGLASGTLVSWRAVAELMGVSALPRFKEFPDRSAPLTSSSQRLYVVGNPTLGSTQLDPIYRAYVDYLATYATRWINRLPHDVDTVRWVDGLEVPGRRQAIVELMLMCPEAFLRQRSVLLGRVGHAAEGTVDAMWVFALSRLGWPVFPGERGVGREPIRVPAQKLWRLPEGARRSGYAQVINVVPHAFSAASNLLGALGIPSVEDAPLERLFEALGELAARLDEERLHTRREALSLAIELYAQIDERLEKVTLGEIQHQIQLPLLRDRRLEAVDPKAASVIVLFDDEPARARHITGLERAYRVPIARDARIERVHALFARTWGQNRVLRTSTAKIELEFTPSPPGAESFLAWLQRQYPHGEVAAELAAMLTLGGERSVRAEPVSRAWKDFERLKIVFGSFGDSTITSFYDRTADTLMMSSTLERHDVIAKTWELAGARSQDLWAGYARALRDSNTHTFLRDHEISEVEIVEVADAAGLHRLTSVNSLAPALLAARCHMNPGTSLEDAAAWFASVGDRPEDVARELGRPELAAVLDAALGQRSPDGEIQVVRYLGVPWAMWQDAVLRRDAVRYVFPESVQRYTGVRDHLVAVARELGVRDASTDLKLLSTSIAGVVSEPVPEAVQFLPHDVAAVDDAAWRSVRTALALFEPIAQALTAMPTPPWQAELPIPEAATRRGVRLFRDTIAVTREIEATTSVRAIVQVAARLASSIGERINTAEILADSNLSVRLQGEWAHVYAAQLLLRSLIEQNAPETFKKLSAVQAFRDVTTISALMARFPDIPRTEPVPSAPKQPVLGLELTVDDIHLDLGSGSSGALGAKLAEAAAVGLDPAILNGTRIPLPPSPGGGGGGGGRGSTGRSRREPELVGDIGEAFVHEWLTFVLGADYGPDCWVSEARERYGLPKSGKDGLGYDFRVPDPDGRLFGIPAAAYLIEVKSTTTDGSGSFPMSSAEWDRARRCHENVDDAVYVILRVVQTDSRPRIGDFVIDPFAAHRRGEIRLAERDLWVRVAPRQAKDSSTASAAAERVPMSACERTDELGAANESANEPRTN